MMKTPVDPAHCLESRYVRVAADGTATDVIVRIGLPFRVSADEWRCPSEVTHAPAEKPMDIAGADAIQAMRGAIRVTGALIERMVASGDTLYVGDDRSLPLDVAMVRRMFGGA